MPKISMISSETATLGLKIRVCEQTGKRNFVQLTAVLFMIKILLC